MSSTTGDAPSIASTDGSSSITSSSSMSSNNFAGGGGGGAQAAVDHPANADGATIVGAVRQTVANDATTVGNSAATSSSSSSSNNNNNNNGPAQQNSSSGSSSSSSSLDSQIERLKRCEHLRENEVKALCLRAREILVDEGNVQRVDAPVTVSFFVFFVLFFLRTHEGRWVFDIIFRP